MKGSCFAICVAGRNGGRTSAKEAVSKATAGGRTRMMAEAVWPLIIFQPSSHATACTTTIVPSFLISFSSPSIAPSSAYHSTPPRSRSLSSLTSLLLLSSAAEFPEPKIKFDTSRFRLRPRFCHSTKLTTIKSHHIPSISSSIYEPCSDGLSTEHSTNAAHIARVDTAMR